MLSLRRPYLEKTVLQDSILALGLALVPFIIYPGGIELAGDQTVQIIAAQALVEEGHLRVPLRTDDPHPKELIVGTDLRRTLRWFPPGYSILIAVGVKLGLSVASAASLLFFLHRAIFSFFWLRIGRYLGIPSIEVLGAILFCIVIFYPSTTTDGFAAALVGALLLVFLSLKLPIALFGGDYLS